MALTQVSSAGIKNAEVKTEDILDANVTTAKVADNAITGAKVADNLDIPDNNKIRFGTGNDLEIYHSSDISRIRNTNDSGTLKIQATSNGENAINIVPNGTVELYYDGVKQCETNSGGMNWADGKRAYFGNSSDLQILHDGTDSFIINNEGNLDIKCESAHAIHLKHGSEKMLRAVTDGVVELYYDNSKKFETSSNGVNLYGNLVLDNPTNAGKDINWLPQYDFLRFEDNVKAVFGNAGAGAGDLHIYHDGSVSRIQDDSNPLYLKGNHIYLYKGGSGEKFIHCTTDAQVELYYDASLKFDTQSDGVKFYGHLYTNDANKIQLGNGQDLQIYHSGSASKINNSTGNLYIEGTTEIWNTAGDEALAKFTTNGAVELYYDNSKKFETNSSGTKTWGGHIMTNGGTVTGGDLAFADSSKAKFGDGNDLQLYHDGSSSYITNETGNTFVKTLGGQFHVRPSGNEEGIIVKPNAEVELFYNNSRKFETLSDGVRVDGVLHWDSGNSGRAIELLDNQKIFLGDGTDLQIYHTGSVSHIEDNVTNVMRISADSIGLQSGDKSEAGLVYTKNGSVDIYYDNTKMIETTTSGAKVNGILEVTSHVKMGDLDTLLLGDGNDLQLYHDGTDSYIVNSTGELKITDAGLIRINTDDLRVYKGNGTELTFRAEGDGGCTLFYDNSQKLETTSSGIKTNGRAVIDGHCYPEVNNNNECGGPSNRWSTIYSQNSLNTSDRNLKNTIKTSDLGLSFINQLNPVSYKFNLVTGEKQDTKTHYGLIAQEVEEVIKKEGKTTDDFAAVVEEEGTYNLAYSELISPLIKAIKELSAEVEILKTEVAALKAK